MNHTFADLTRQIFTSIPLLSSITYQTVLSSFKPLIWISIITFKGKLCKIFPFYSSVFSVELWYIRPFNPQKAEPGQSWSKFFHRRSFYTPSKIKLKILKIIAKGRLISNSNCIMKRSRDKELKGKLFIHNSIDIQSATSLYRIIHAFRLGKRSIIRSWKVHSSPKGDAVMVDVLLVAVELKVCHLASNSTRTSSIFRYDVTSVVAV